VTAVDDFGERVAYLEGRSEEQARMVDVIRDGLASIVARMDSFDSRLVGLEERIDRRFELIDKRFVGIERRLDNLDYKFGWFIGIGVTVAMGVFGQWFVR
jgi:hypothetical protein